MRSGTLYTNQVKALRTALGPLCGRSLKFCTDACLRRYLEARNWNVDKAKKMIEETLKWRDTYKPEEIRWVSLTLCSKMNYYVNVSNKCLLKHMFVAGSLLSFITGLFGCLACKFATEC